MGNGVSRFAGSGTLKRLVNAANLPLEVDDDISHDQMQDPGKVLPRSQHHMFCMLSVFLSFSNSSCCLPAPSTQRVYPGVRRQRFLHRSEVSCNHTQTSSSGVPEFVNKPAPCVYAYDGQLACSCLLQRFQSLLSAFASCKQ